MELNMATVEEKKYEKSEEPDEIDEAYTDRNMQHEKKKYEKKLVTTRRQKYELDKVRCPVKRPRPAFDAHEDPQILTTSPPEEPLQPFGNTKPLPIPHSPDISNTAKLKLSSVQDQEDLTEKLAPQHKGKPTFECHLCKRVVRQENEATHMKKVHKDDSSDSEYLMEKVHKDDSSDSEYLVEKVLLYRMEMAMETVKKRKYKVLGETVEVNEVPTDRDAIMKNSTYGNSALEQWPTEAPEVSNTKENRSLEGQDGTNQATSDDKDKGINLIEEKMKVGRHDEEEHVPNEDIDKEMDVKEHDKPLGIDNNSGDDDEEEADDGSYTEFSDEPTEQYDKSVYGPPIDDTASEGPDEVGAISTPNTEADYNSTKTPAKEPLEGIDDAEIHDGEYMIALNDRNNNTTTMLHLKPISPSIPLPQDHHASHLNSAGSYSGTPSMKADYSPTTRNSDHVTASLSHVNITTLLDDGDASRPAGFDPAADRQLGQETVPG